MTKDTYVDDMIAEIRNDWFKDHKVTIIGEEGFQQIIWSKGSFEYRTKYILSGNNIFVSGDMGEAVYTLTCPATLDNIKEFNLGYFTGKLRAYHEDKYDFNEVLAKQQLNEIWDEWDFDDYDDSEEIYNKTLSSIEESNNVKSYQFWLSNAYHNTSLSCDDYELLEDLGKQLTPRLIAYWVGLKMIIEQLDALKINIEKDDENETI